MKPVINLISGPRNISTALMYSFAQHPNIKVLDEPFYGYYLKNANLQVTHPMEEDIIQGMETNFKEIVESINEFAETNSVFVKGMAHHYIMEDPSFILNWKNVILIRHPKKLIASFSKVIENPSLNDIGIKKAAELYSYLDSKGKTPLVIDSDALMIDPKRYLQKLCSRLEIPFSNDMLSWKKGGIPEDGLWAPYWYKNVHSTSSFSVQQAKPASFPITLKGLLKESLPYYETLQKSILLND